MTNLRLLGAVLVLTLGASRAVAQAPATAPPPPPPQTAAPAPVLRPPTAPPPPAAAPAGAANRTATAAPVLPPGPASALPPDSVRPAPAVAPAAPPANAVAQCRDGTFVVAPSDPSACAAHRGLLVRMPEVRTPVPPPARAAAPVAAARAATPEVAPPAGATMRCKDGTYLTGAPAAGRCDSYGGLAVVLPPARETPPPPLPRRP